MFCPSCKNEAYWLAKNDQTPNAINEQFKCDNPDCEVSFFTLIRDK